MNEFSFDDKLRRALLSATVLDFGLELETANIVSVTSWILENVTMYVSS